MGRNIKIPEDSSLPQLGQIFNPNTLNRKFREIFANDCGEQAASQLDFEIAKCVHKPGILCNLKIKVKYRNGRAAVDKRFYMGRFWVPGKGTAQKVLQKFNPDNLARPEIGPPVIYIPEWEMVLWTYPNDPNLPGLALLEQPDKILAMISSEPQKYGLPGQALKPVSIQPERMTYSEGRRCGFLYQLVFQPENGQRNEIRHRLFVKAFRRGYGKDSYEAMLRFWNSEACQRGEVALPRPYSFDEKNYLMWQEGIEGETLAKSANRHQNLPELAFQIGRGLAAFHAIKLDLPEQMTLAYQVAEIGNAARAIAENFPDYADAYERIKNKLLNYADALENVPLTVVHGSFKFSHIIWTTTGIRFIDFDAANLGDPGYDLGRFIAHLYKMKTMGKIDPEIAEQTISNFCTGYNQKAERPMSRARINWFAASHLVASQAFKCVKKSDPRLLQALCRMAEDICPE